MSDGTAVFAVRSEQDLSGAVDRQPYVYSGTGADGFTNGAWMAGHKWPINACPMTGPRVWEARDGSALGVWTDPTGGNETVWFVRSHDGGQTWQGETEISYGGPALKNPTVADAPDGTVWVTAQQMPGTVITTSVDGGASFAAFTPLESPDGALEWATVESVGSVTAIVGRSVDTGSVWLYRP